MQAVTGLISYEQYDLEAKDQKTFPKEWVKILDEGVRWQNYQGVLIIYRLKGLQRKLTNQKTSTFNFLVFFLLQHMEYIPPFTKVFKPLIISTGFV